MLSIPTSTTLGIVFILIGGAAVWLILDSSRRTHNQTARERAIYAHRIAGYVFVALFAFMAYMMTARVGQEGDDLPARTMLHIGIAVVLLPLIFFKVLIARYYKSYTAVLAPLGLAIFTLAVLLIVSATAPRALRALHDDISPQDIATDPDKVDLRAASDLMQRRCTHCHALDRVSAVRKDPQAWIETVKRMRAMPQSDIWEGEAKVILSYLLAEQSASSSKKRDDSGSGKELVDSYCARCHALDRVYQSAKSEAAWKTTVTRMKGYARGTKGAFTASQEGRIIEFLSAKQDAGKPANPVRDAAFNSTPASAPPAFEPVEEGPSLPRQTTGVTLGIALFFGMLVWRRPKPRSLPVAAASLPVQRRPVAALPDPGKPMLLELARTERQTHDCVTHRFRVVGNDGFHARPGQFLSFDWLFDGRKVTRCYSISSSPSQRGFIEITVKKQPQGNASRFLNERTQPSLTVEASGPFGRFYFDETQHKKIALFGGGSGITPLISMLRYIDDLCLDTEATLFYTVRTAQDIIFERELGRLEKCLPKFRRITVVTRPDSNWVGPKGYLGPELIQRHIANIDEYTCFMCGPAPYMDHVQSVLLEMGVDPQKINQESFGGSKAQPKAADADPLKAADKEAPAASVEFARSGRTIAISSERTLLEAAESNGVHLAFGCRQGQCGTCATPLLSGLVEMEREDGLPAAMKAQGYILPCVARVKGDIRLDA